MDEAAFFILLYKFSGPAGTTCTVQVIIVSNLPDSCASITDASKLRGVGKNVYEKK